ECPSQHGSPAARHQDLQSKPDFQYRHCSRPYRCSWLPVEPIDNALVGHLAHQRRKHVCIQNNHDSKSKGLTVCPRSSGISASSPILLNKPAISFPNPPVATGSSTATLRRMSRISSSMLRPFRRARRCNRALTASSIFRTTNWAIRVSPCTSV